MVVQLLEGHETSPFTHLFVLGFALYFLSGLSLELLNFDFAVIHELVREGLAGESEVIPAADPVRDTKAPLHYEPGILIGFRLAYGVGSRKD